MRKKILVVGPALSRSGYGEQCRFALRSLKAHEERFDIYLQNINWGQTGWVISFSEERKWLDKLLLKTAQYRAQGGQFDISLQVTIPNEWQKLAPVNVGYTAGIESDRIAPVWIEKSQLMDRLIVISNHAKYGFDNTAYEATNNQTGQEFVLKNSVPVEVVSYPVRHYEPVDIELGLETDFNFLTVSQWGPRKNLGNTIQGFVEEFIDQEVGLIVKTSLRNNSLADRRASEERISHLLEAYPQRQCKVYLLHGDMTPNEMTSLYRHSKVKALISLSHAEGFGLSTFEAAYNGLPVIAPNWSGHMDFMCMPVKSKKKGKVREKIKSMFATVDYTIAPVQKEAIWDGVIQADSQWSYPKQGSYKMRLREMVKDHGRYKKQALALQAHVLKEFSAEAQYESFANNVYAEEEHDLEGWLEDFDAEVHA
tara:strand:- start:1706 stop:2977 length:1272 start_codon:yes stop_codon:yes gene_type:complete